MALNKSRVADTTQLNGSTKTHMNGTKDDYVYKVQIVWKNVIIMAYLHLGALYASYLMFTGRVMAATIVFSFFHAYMTGTAITGGAHRLWTHNAYKARWPLRLLLAYFQTAAFQNHIYEWVRDHRVHHKFCDTDADPHNSKRGFFFSHVGWLLVRKHRDVKEKGKSIDMSDLEKDPIVMFQKKYYSVTLLLSWLIIPTVIPWYFWGEDLKISYWANIFRYIYSLNATWCVNSLAHMWGDKPYDRNFTSTNSLFVGLYALGEGWHNYHHAFPWDYKASELWNVNLTTNFINFFAKIGWAYDLKEASEELIKRRALRTGDGSPTEVDLGTRDKVNTDSYNDHINHHEGEVWGFEDKDLTQEERDMILIKNKQD